MGFYPWTKSPHPTGMLAGFDDRMMKLLKFKFLNSEPETLNSNVVQATWSQ